MVWMLFKTGWPIFFTEVSNDLVIGEAAAKDLSGRNKGFINSDYVKIVYDNLSESWVVK